MTLSSASSCEWRNVAAPVLGILGVGCWEYDLTTGTLWWSDAAGPLVGRPPGFCPATFDAANALFDQDERRLPDVAELVDGLAGGPVEAEIRAILPDGSRRWIHHRYFVADDEAGRPVRMLGMMSDIDARKRQELTEHLLVEAAGALAGTLDLDETLAVVGRLLVDDLADWCVVHLLDDEGRLRPVLTSHADPDKVRWADAIQAEYPVDMDSPVGAPNVVRTGEPELHPEIPDAMLVAAAQGDARRLEIMRQVGYRSALIVPLLAVDGVIGTLSLVMAESGRRYDDGSVAVARRMAAKLAGAIRSAQLHARVQELSEERRHAVDTLQRGLTPDPLPDFEGVELAAHYQISRAMVGGDWYDAFATDAGALALVVGDVTGGGIEAVSAMSRLRHAVKALLFVGHPPGEAMTLLNRLATAAFPERYVLTVCCAVFDPSTRELRWSRAGHPLPILRHPDGRVELVHRMDNPPVGAFEGHRFVDRQAVVRPGTSLVLYSDGLVERRGESIDASMKRLADLLLDAPPGASGIVEHVRSGIALEDATDDVTILVGEF